MPSHPPLSSLPHPPHIRIAGFSGSGKSTLAQNLSARLHIAHLEEDSIHFKSPGFTLIDTPSIHASAIAFTTRYSASGFVTDGFWKDIHDILMPQTNVVIVLDFPLHIVFWRLLKRTAWRVWSGETLWNTDVRETLGTALSLWKPDNIFRHMLTQYYHSQFVSNEKAKLRELWAKEGWSGTGLVDRKWEWRGERVLMTFRHPREVEAWLRT
ncbi:hypothetical protein HDU98_007101 [Podochytrium sp. JEL0797]|nr:hypothetical protein HDU98_007101 [Podochytrium sp. JEL0797]